MKTMEEIATIRAAGPQDQDAVDRLLLRSYPALLAADYPPSFIVTVVPLMARAQPALLQSGTYFVLQAAGDLRAAGGYTWHAPTGGRQPGVAHIRHVATDKDHVRKGYAAAVLGHAMAHARDRGAVRFECLSTKTAVPFYTAMGFRIVREETMEILAGIPFSVVRMRSGRGA